jgi:hypothetical protein
VWRGEDPDYDDTINPVTGLPYVYPVNQGATTDPTVTSPGSGKLEVTFKRPTTTTNYAGALISIFKNGSEEQMLNAELLSSLKYEGITASSGTTGAVGTTDPIKDYIVVSGTSTNVTVKLKNLDFYDGDDPISYRIVIEARTSATYTYGLKRSEPVVLEFLPD